MDELIQALREGVVNVVFTKKNGEERHMKCTRDMIQIPEDHHPTGANTAPDSVIAVWDLEKEGWRCFRKDSIISWETE